jgi:SAM-dependent methyltransferase
MSGFVEYFNALAEYSGSGSLEVELRFLIDSRYNAPASLNLKKYTLDETKQMVKHLVKKYPGNIEQTINVIAGEKIKQLLFIRGEQQKDKVKYYTKQKITELVYVVPEDTPAYRIGANVEAETPEFPISMAQLARIKCRHSATHADFPGWRLDITAVKNVENFASNPTALKDAKNKMLYPLESADFAERAPFDLADSLEIELEFVDDIKTLSTGRLAVLANIFTTPATTTEHQQIIYQVAQFLKPGQAARFKSEYGLKQLGNKVIELDKRIYTHEMTITAYYMCDKNDGERAILYLSPKCSYAIQAAELEQLPIVADDVYIFDSEFIDQRYIIFDVMVWQGTQLHEPFKKRLDYFERAAAMSPQFETKPFIRMTEKYAEQIRAFKAADKKYATDGIVFTPADEQYETMRVYKYKPIERLTVDFLIKKCPDRLLGVAPFTAVAGKTLYLLFSGMSRQVFLKLKFSMCKFYNDLFPQVDLRSLPDYFPVPFSPANATYAYLYYGADQLDSQVGEFGYHGGPEQAEQNDGWILHKIRHDRASDVQRGNYFGNDFIIAEKIWFSYATPLVIEDEQQKSYFTIHENAIQKASRNFNNYVKSKMFKDYAGANCILDISSGKGQDLFRYGTVGTKRLVCVEIDRDAIQELIYRKADFAKERGAGMAINVARVDINEPYQQNIKIINAVALQAGGCDVVLCNLAFHYFLGTSRNITNVIKFIDYYLKPGGRFVFTSYDGRAVLGLLNKHNGDYTVKNTSGETVYSIRGKYASRKLDDFGQSIEVLLPFSIGYYTEFLVNIEYLTAEFAKFKIVLEQDESYGAYLPKYPAAAQLNADDREYVALYHKYVFYKTEPRGAAEKQAAKYKIVTRRH